MNTKIQNSFNAIYKNAKYILIGCTAFFAITLIFQNIGTSEIDPDKIIAQKIEHLQARYDAEWKLKGLPIASAKEELYIQDQEINKDLENLAKEIEENKNKITKKDILKDWKPAYSEYYTPEKKKYKIIEEATGGSDEVLSTSYTKPEDLFYTCLKSYGCYVTQSDKEHMARNNYIATDVGTNNSNFPVHAPDWKNKSVQYTARYVNYPKTTGNTVELTGEIDGVKIMWRIGHVHWIWNDRNFKNEFDGKKVDTGTILAMSGGETEEGYKAGGDQGATTGRHVHIEYLIFDGSGYAPTFYRIENKFNIHKSAEDLASTKKNPTLSDLKAGITDNPINEGKDMFPRMVYVTTYNPEVGQNDGDPWTGAAGVRMEEGMIALSRDLIRNLANSSYNQKSPIEWGQKVHLESDNPQCTGDYTVMDTMNKRFKNRADIFKVNRKDNTSCIGTISIL